MPDEEEEGSREKQREGGLYRWLPGGQLRNRPKPKEYGGKGK